VIRRAMPEDAAQIAPLLGELGYPSTAAQVEARLAALPANELLFVAEVDGAGNHRVDAHAFYERVGYESTGLRFSKRL